MQVIRNIKFVKHGFTALFLLLFIGCQIDETAQPSTHSTPNLKVVEFFKKIDLMSDSSRTPALENLLHGAWEELGPVPDTFLFQKYEYLSKMYQFDGSKLELSLRYLDTLDAFLSKKDGFRKFKLHVLYTRGQIAIRNKNYQEAVNYFYKGRSLIDFSIDPCNAFTYLNSLAEVQYNFGNHRKAIDHLSEALKYQQECLQATKRTNVLASLMLKNDIAISYERLGMLDSSAFVLQQVLNFIDSIDIDSLQAPNRGYRIKGVILGNLGGVLLKQKKYLTAEKHLRNSIAINNFPTREPEDALYTKIKLANLLLATNRVQACMELANQLLTDSILPALPEARRRLYNLLYKLNASTGADKKALYYRDIEIGIQDSLAKARSWDAFMPDFNKEFDNLTNQIGLLESEKIRSRQWYLQVILLIVLLSVGGFTFSQVQKRRSQATFIKELSDLNRQISKNNEKLLLNLNLLEASLEENNKLVRVIAHDLRAPVSSMLGLIELMKKDGGNIEAQKQYLELLETSGLTSLNLIEDIMERRNARQLNRSETNLAELIDFSVQLQKPQAAQKKITISMDLFDLIVQVDNQKLLRVFLNLVANAIKFSYNDGHIEICMARNEGNVRISVQDFGTGIPAEMLPLLFSFLPQGGQTGTEGEKSFGMGLAIAAQIVKEHNGRIWCESEPGKGATFFVELPVA